jgi:phage baseplate assembly protein W
MALSPLQPIEDRVEIVEETTEIQPSRTYSLNFDTGEIGGIIDGYAAIEQFIRKAIATPRFHYPIYSDDYGCEIESLIGQDISQELLEQEVERFITEALIYDERIAAVSGFEITRDSEKLYVSFLVTTIDGLIVKQEVTI